VAKRGAAVFFLRNSSKKNATTPKGRPLIMSEGQLILPLHWYEPLILFRGTINDVSALVGTILIVLGDT